MVVADQGRRQTVEHIQVFVKIPSQALTIGTTEKDNLPTSSEAKPHFSLGLTHWKAGK